jgi:hypothetical protein
MYLLKNSYSLFPVEMGVNPLNGELNPTCHLLALLGDATIVVVSRLRAKGKVRFHPVAGHTGPARE